VHDRRVGLDDADGAFAQLRDGGISMRETVAEQRRREEGRSGIAAAFVGGIVGGDGVVDLVRWSQACVEAEGVLERNDCERCVKCVEFGDLHTVVARRPALAT
jgi:hypothetical protein